ncbi:MAG: helix-turn-helix transcriptional regulator [Alphaproteobacteria bacterium]|nr:helix-turn-helix transcriptional regulator [Alphaproteobacteria bacterium]
MNKMPKPVATTKETVTLARADWEMILGRLDDTADRTALRRSLARAVVDKDDALPAALYRRVRRGENALRIWREYRGLGLNALARAAGVSAPYLSEIENGTKPGSAVVLKKLAHTLEIDMDELV